MTSSKRECEFRELAERNLARWTGIARAYAVDRDRDDLMQEMMMQVWKSMDGFEGRSHIDTWGYRIALNTALAWKRSARSRAGSLKSSSTKVDHLPGESKSHSIEIRVLDEFLASLSKMDRAVMLLFLDATPTSDSAEIMGITEGALRVRLHRIRKTFEETYCNREITNDI